MIRLNLSNSDLKLMEKVIGAKIEKVEVASKYFFDNLFDDINSLLKIKKNIN